MSGDLNDNFDEKQLQSIASNLQGYLRGYQKVAADRRVAEIDIN